MKDTKNLLHRRSEYCLDEDGKMHFARLMQHVFEPDTGFGCSPVHRYIIASDSVDKAPRPLGNGHIRVYVFC